MNESHHQDPLQDLLTLSHELGREDRHMAILGEGNTSARLNHGTFLVKASGGNLGTLRAEEVVECHFETLLPLVEEEEEYSDEEIEKALYESRVVLRAKKPSVEALFHAWLLSLPDVYFVGHTHSLCVNQILCSPRARDFAERRMFPDEIVCCGKASVLVPYTDPGVKLAHAVARETSAHVKKHGQTPRVILIKNHGIITLGITPAAVLAAALMAEKAADIFVGASSLGGPDFLNDADVERIATRSDEHYRQQAMKF